jgi:hypothetical protein
MPTPTYTPLATVTLGGTASSVTFSSIPATYRDLVLVYSGTTSGYSIIRANSDTGANYNRVIMEGNGSTFQSYSNTGQTFFDLAQPPDLTDVRTLVIQFMDYSATDKHKTVIHRANGTTGSGSTGGQAMSGAFRWANTGAITSLQYSQFTGNFQVGCTFALYGIAS